MAVANSHGCNNPADSHPSLISYLSEHGLLSYGQTGDFDTLTDRNQDRVRILKYISNHPEGVKQTVLVHHVLKGVNPDNYYGTPDLSGDSFENHDNWSDKYYNGDSYTYLDGSDKDYQFCNRFLKELSESTDLVRFEVRTEHEHQGRWVFPTLSLLDLISSGIMQTTTESDELVYDKEFCKNVLRNVDTPKLALPDWAKDLFANSLRRYIQRVRDYRLAFDVLFADRTGVDQRRMYKPYKTRFTSEGRRDRNFARLQDSLEWGAEHGTNAVFCTLTTDPKKFPSLLDAIDSMYSNFNALMSYMARDPSTKADSRKETNPGWSGPDSSVTGRPRERLEYIRVLEFTEKGYPHLHVLFFNPPSREKDGMPWLIDKNELEHYWNKDTANRTGQGRIVDLYPLVYRDDLDELEPEFNSDSGYVSWYRFGDHDYSKDWVNDKERYHQKHGQIDFAGDDNNPMHKTAGSYIGKYLAETYAQLENLESLDVADWDPDDDGDKGAWWKLGLYWATEKRFWSPSRKIREDIKLDSDRNEIRKAVADCTTISLMHNTKKCYQYHASYPELDTEKSLSLFHRLSKELVASMELDARDVGQTTTCLARVNYLGAYHVEDLPALPERPIRPEVFESAVHSEESDIELASLGDRPPPVTTVWHS